MNEGWYRLDLIVQDSHASRWFVAQVFAVSVYDAIEQIERQVPENWHVPMMSIGLILEPLKPNELGWQSKNR